jgi:hypothetical protein
LIVIERRKIELALVEAKYGELEVGPNHDWFVVKRWKLVPGWNKAETQVLVLLPPGYPTTPADNFHTDADLRLANGSQPGSASSTYSHNGRQWSQFSYHVESGDWKPHADPLLGHNLLTFLEGVGKRLSEAN